MKPLKESVIQLAESLQSSNSNPLGSATRALARAIGSKVGEIEVEEALVSCGIAEPRSGKSGKPLFFAYLLRGHKHASLLYSQL